MTSKQKDRIFVHSNFIIVTVGIEVVEAERRNGQPAARALSLVGSVSGAFASVGNSRRTLITRRRSTRSTSNLRPLYSTVSPGLRTWPASVMRKPAIVV